MAEPIPTPLMPCFFPKTTEPCTFYAITASVTAILSPWIPSVKRLMEGDSPPPSLPWRFGSATVMGFIGILTRTFMYGANSMETHGLDSFLDLVDERRDIDQRQRGLITVSNHISILDDPMMWGILPYSYCFNPSNHRWSLGSYDIVFKNKLYSTFFTLGQVLPTHRLQYSPHGGPFQPTMREAIRLLSHPPFHPTAAPSRANPSLHSPDITDPFSSPSDIYTYTTNGTDTFPAPSAFANRQYSWIHIFPEGRVHQHPRKMMRYFHWGVARLILEPDVCPDIIPIWIEGNNEIYNENRTWPRWVPRAGKKCAVWIGDNVGGEKENVFHEMRSKWRDLVEANKRKGAGELAVGVLDDELKYGEEAVALRKECAMQVRREVLAVRRMRGLPDEDPKQGLWETWREEGGKREGWMDDGSVVKDV